MYDVIAVGDTTIDMFLRISEGTVQCSLDEEACKLVLDYGGKVPVDSTERIIGVGNAANNVMGITKLGLKGAIYTHVGDDDCGKDMVAKFAREGVPTDYIVYDQGKKTNYSTVIDYQGDRTILVYHADRTYKLPRFKKPKWIYFSSIMGNHDELNAELVSYIKKKKVKLAFNPGTHQMRLGVKKLASVLSVTDILFVNKEEGERLVGKKKTIPGLLRALARKGPKTVVVTNGRKGSHCLHDGNIYNAGLLESTVVERTGCGDAYASGFLAATIKGLGPEDAMKWGSANAASVVEHVGSQRGLLTASQLTRTLAEHPEFVVA